MTIKISTTRIASALLAVVPILSIYKVGPLLLNFGDLACVFIVLLTIFDIVTHRVAVTKCYFILYFSVSFLISLIMILIRGRFDFADFAAKWLRIIVIYCIVDISAYTRIDHITFVKWCIGAGLITSTLLYIQVIGDLFFSRPIFFYLKVFPLNIGISASELIMQHIRTYAYGGWRPFSVFTEPAHFASFVLLPLSITLFSKKEIMTRRKRVFCSVYLSLAIVLSRSAIGMFGTIMLLAVWYFRSLASKATVGKIIAIFLVAAGVMYLLGTTEYFELAMDRLRSVRSGGSTTGTIRLLQGLAVYDGLPWLEKVIGIGYGNVYAYLVGTRTVTNYLLELGNEYMNSFSTVLVSGGIIGFVVYMAIWINIFFEKKDIESRAVYSLISVLFVVASGFYSVSTAMYLGYIRCPKQYDQIEQ